MRILALLYFILHLTAGSCYANGLQLNGPGPRVPIRRSNNGNWGENSSSSIALNITTVGILYRITVEGVVSGGNWTGRYLSVKIPNDDIAVWLGISPLADFHLVLLVNDGISTGSNELVNNLRLGIHPPAKLLYQGRADKIASTGDADLTVTYTLLPEP